MTALSIVTMAQPWREVASPTFQRFIGMRAGEEPLDHSPTVHAGPPRRTTGCLDHNRLALCLALGRDQPSRGGCYRRPYPILTQRGLWCETQVFGLRTEAREGSLAQGEEVDPKWHRAYEPLLAGAEQDGISVKICSVNIRGALMEYRSANITPARHWL